MALSIGITGLPNVGKSTLFNALTKAQNAEAANYPFCTIEPNKATVAVPDSRIAELARLVNPQRTVYAVVDFIDIAGLVRGASKGEGLGNQFLANIRETSAILEVVRCFDDENITHVEGGVDPVRDVEVIETELLLADIQTVEKRLEKVARQAKGDKAMQTLKAELEIFAAAMNEGKGASVIPQPDNELFRHSIQDMGLLTAKRIIYCANIDEETLASGGENQHTQALSKLASSRGAGFLVICAKIEEEMQGLSESDQAEMLSSYGITESGLASVISVGYHTLGLSSYFTAGEKEVKAWTITNGFKAPQAAGVIHSDFERGFIRAEVIAYDDYIRLGSEAAARSAGLLRVEGKEYAVKDGDVMHFLFNV